MKILVYPYNYIYTYICMRAYMLYATVTMPLCYRAAQARGPHSFLKLLSMYCLSLYLSVYLHLHHTCIYIRRRQLATSHYGLVSHGSRAFGKVAVRMFLRDWRRRTWRIKSASEQCVYCRICKQLRSHTPNIATVTCTSNLPQRLPVTLAIP